VSTQQDSNSINRVLKARGLPTLDESGVVEALAFMVEDHQHLTELLRACEPTLRRDMYESMRPHLRFIAKPLEDYIIAAKAHAEAAELPVMDEQGFLHPYRVGVVEVPEIELWAQCAKCQKEGIFVGSNTGDAIFTMRSSGWAFDESSQQRHLCPECLEGVSDPLD
jgi:hypothetical protein